MKLDTEHTDDTDGNRRRRLSQIKVKQAYHSAGKDMHEEIRQRQESICTKYKAGTVACPAGMKLGIARNVRDGVLPINGLRLRPEGDTCGWFIWAGEMSEAADFFVPLHVDHLKDWCPSAIPFLLLPPGWRFLVAPNYEDLWFDSELLSNAEKPSI